MLGGGLALGTTIAALAREFQVGAPTVREALQRLAIGGIGASFVITQYHTSVMFAPNRWGRREARFSTPALARWRILASSSSQNPFK